MVGCVVILFINHEMLIPAIKSIFVAAFDPRAILGGAVGITVREAMRYGVARGLFSNEAGMGSTPHAHALAKVEKPQDQGVIAMIGVFVDTFIVLTLTALVILTSGQLQAGVPGALEGTDLAQAAFNSAFGSFGNIFVAICMLFFAFSTIIGWYFFGESNVKALFGKKAVKIYAAIVVGMHHRRFCIAGQAGMESVRPVQCADGIPQPDCTSGTFGRCRQRLRMVTISRKTTNFFLKKKVSKENFALACGRD